MRRSTVVLALAVASAVAACGGGRDGRFDDDVAAVREAVEAGDATGAEQALETLAVDALAAHGDGVIDDAELQEVADLVDASRTELAQIMPTTTTTTAVTTTTPAPPPPVVDQDDGDGDDGDDDDDKVKPGKGKGRGNGGDEDDDD